jgi:hypothetical protein
MLLNIVPKLAAHIDNDFEVNPLDQKMEPLNRVLNWSSLLRESTFAQILEEKFFPSWLDTLHFWLVQPNYSAGEVASWSVLRYRIHRCSSRANVRSFQVSLLERPFLSIHHSKGG